MNIRKGYVVFTDKRSKKVLFVAHCILNQNAKIDQCVHYPGAMKEITQTCLDAGISLIQMPCPEILYLGLDRQVDQIAPHTIESEDTRVAQRMGENQALSLCSRLTDDLVFQIEQYQQHGFEVLGVIGINGSPTCGVETNWADDEEKPGFGVFMQALTLALAEKDISLPIRGVKASQPTEAVACLTEMLHD